MANTLEWRMVQSWKLQNGNNINIVENHPPIYDGVLNQAGSDCLPIIWNHYLHRLHRKHVMMAIILISL